MSWIDELKKQLEIDEGIRYEVYKDSQGYYTCGIGHLITPRDPEWDAIKKAGDYKLIKITPERVNDLFLKDVQTCVADCSKIFKDFNDFSDDLKEIIANMMFNLGLARFSLFKKFIADVENKDYKMAANEMLDSLWAKQVKERADRLVQRMSNLG